MTQRSVKARLAHYLAVWGCFSTGIVYFAIGVVAMLSFLKLKDGGADEASLLVYLNNYIAGKFVVWVVMLGMIAYIVWRVYETFNDPYGYGSSAKGIAKRTGVALSGFADALIAFSAVQALLGIGETVETGVPVAERKMAETLLNESWGTAVVAAIGVACVVTALVQIGYAAARSYEERMNLEKMPRWTLVAVHVLAWTGHFARGVILGIIGVSFISAAVSTSAQHVVNTDKAFDFIGDNIGHFSFIAVAVCTVFYGLFMFAFGFYHDPDKD